MHTNAATLLAAAMFITATATGNELHVSVSGCDDNSGTADRPFATIGRARDAVRQRIAAGLAAPITVRIHGGMYRIAEPLAFGPEDSGTEQHTVSYAAAPGETPILSGGRPITGWKDAGDGTWIADIAQAKDGQWRFRELFINRSRATRARHPNQGHLRVVKAGPDNRTSFTVKPGDLPAADLAGAELIFFHDWSITRIPVKSVEGQTLTTAGPIGAAALAFFAISGFEPNPRYYLENSIAFLDAPGEWHLDTVTGRLHYRPLPGQTIDKLEAVAPVAAQLLSVRGEGGRPVRNLRFSGLTFEHCAFLPADGRYAGVQACFHEVDKQLMRGAVSPAIELVNAHACRFENNVVRHVGGSGIWMGKSCRDCVVSGCTVQDVSANGIMIGATSKEQTAIGNTVADNLVEHCGRQFFGAIGIWAGLTERTTIAHNEVRYLPYTGVSVGWIWNPTPSPCRQNVIEANHIHHVMQVLSDGGGIYTLGLQPRSIIRGNWIHDVPLNAGRAESNGMFLDEGTTDYTIEGNLIHGVTRSPLRFHKATTNLVRNNVLVCGKGVPPIRYNATDPKNITQADNTILDAAADLSAHPTAAKIRDGSGRRMPSK